ncbi:MAG: PAS domain S-box protein [Saprospiraceae bacterium]
MISKTAKRFSDSDTFIHTFDQLIAEKKTVIGTKIEMTDGKHLQRDYIPIFNNDSYEGNLWVYTDITDKVNAEIKLEEQRIFYELVLNNMPADIAVFDKDHRYIFLNPQAIKNPELRKWMIGKKDEDYIAYRNHPQEMAVRRRDLFMSVKNSKKLHTLEEELKQPDGSSKFMLRNMHPVLNKEGDVELVVGYGMDITSIKNIQKEIEASEKRYRNVINNSLALITTHDLDGRFISANPMVSKIFGYSNNELIGRSIADFMPEKDKALFNEEYMLNILKDKKFSGLFKVLSKDGKIVYTLFNNFLQEEEGKEPYVIGFAVDITDRIKAERELKLAKLNSEELAQAKQNFLANMSHEIRTPMNAIMGMSKQLSKTHLNDKQSFYLKTISEA